MSLERHRQYKKMVLYWKYKFWLDYCVLESHGYEELSLLKRCVVIILLEENNETITYGNRINKSQVLINKICPIITLAKINVVLTMIVDAKNYNDVSNLKITKPQQKRLEETVERIKIIKDEELLRGIIYGI